MSSLRQLQPSSANPTGSSATSANPFASSQQMTPMPAASNPYVASQKPATSNSYAANQQPAATNPYATSQQPPPSNPYAASQQPPAANSYAPNPYATSQHPAAPNPFMSSQQLIKSDRGLITMSDDSVVMRQVTATHAPDGREFDVRPLFAIVEDILNRSHQMDTTESTTASQTHMILEDKAMQANFSAILDVLSYVIDRIACEIAYKALGGSDPHSTTVSIFNLLASYPWDAKLVLAMAAFALNYGEFWLLAQIYSTNPLAKSMAILRQLPTIMERPGAPFTTRFDAINKLIKTMIDVTRCIVSIRELPAKYISQDASVLTIAKDHFPTAVYWTIRSIVLCASHIQGVTAMGIESPISTSESWELSNLAHKLNNMYELLNKQLETCHRYIEERINNEGYQTLVELIGMTHLDNMKILKGLIYPRDDILPIVDGSTKRRVSIEVLRRKNVLLLISGLDISQEELSILEQIYNESRIHVGRMESQFEVVWIPIIDRTTSTLSEPMQKQFANLQSTMTWYTVHSSVVIEKPVVRFIREVWHFRNKPILVVLDPQGKVVSPNAIHMMWIWGSSAFPFTSTREEMLWREESWRFELLIDGIDTTILDWIKEGKYVFLYGGDDIEWARKFTNNAKAVAGASRIPLEMVYVGKSSKKEQVRRVIASIMVEKLSYCWQDLAMIWFFWTRLESMLFSKIQLGRADDHGDLMMQEIKRLLSYDKEGSWALLAKGSNIVVNGHGATVLTTLVEYDLWKEHIPVKGFDTSFEEHHKKLHGISYPCCRFEFPVTTGRIPGNMRCPECHRPMERFTTFRCCHEESLPPPEMVSPAGSAPGPALL